MSDVLGTFEQAVMLALVRLRHEVYGRAVLKDVQARLNRDVAAGAVYATLDRLEDKALITSRLAPGTAVRGGKPRLYYAIGAAGVRALNESRAAIDQLWHGIGWPLGRRA